MTCGAASRADGLYERRVALKLLRPGLADPNLRLRFTRERQILARLEHAHIARLLDAGIEVSLASNCNPGTSYTTSMNFNVGTAVLQMHLTLAEAVRAATLGGAIGLRAQDRVGSLEVGKRADLHVLDAPAAIHLAYRPGMPLTHAVWRAGRRAV